MNGVDDVQCQQPHILTFEHTRLMAMDSVCTVSMLSLNNTIPASADPDHIPPLSFFDYEDHLYLYILSPSQRESWLIREPLALMGGPIVPLFYLDTIRKPYLGVSFSG